MFWFQLFFKHHCRALGQTVTLNLHRGLQAILENQVTFVTSIHLRTDFAGLKLREMGKRGCFSGIKPFLGVTYNF